MAQGRKAAIVDENQTQLDLDDQQHNVVVDDEPEDVEENFDEGTPIEDLDPNEELWPGGPKIEKIQEWKNEHGEIYVTSLTREKHVVWRTLNRNEYKNHIRRMEQMRDQGQLSEASAGMYNEEAITQMCVLYPQMTTEAMSGELAGIPSIIAQEIMETSGFVALEVRKL